MHNVLKNIHILVSLFKTQICIGVLLQQLYLNCKPIFKIVSIKRYVHIYSVVCCETAVFELTHLVKVERLNTTTLNMEGSVGRCTGVAKKIQLPFSEALSFMNELTVL